ncbi:PREDICTED: uncharacterized protein LOC106896204 [Calidris pugnax]|uniref:uncharacterized protein LOC106896204 n=1 Tax=Calidris pugnax TaxID=198806 RepID=UPI00071D32E4|nr:PREDICTED: uncharacterized protein LOC106896204 [Calidris pugnax]
MVPDRRRWSLGSVLLLLGGTLAVRVQIHQDSVNGTVGQSVLLNISYMFDEASRFPLSICWMFHNSSKVILTCAVQNCSLDAGGAPSNCSATCFPPPPKRGRAELFPDNGSLLLRDLKLSDSGVYVVTFKEPSQSWPITLVVHEQRFPPEHPDPSAVSPGEEHALHWTIGVSSSVALLLLLLLFCYLRHLAQQKKRRIIKQQQVSGVEEPHMESTVVGGMATIYARIGDSFEQPQTNRPTSETVYTSITHPEPSGLDTALYHVVV